MLFLPGIRRVNCICVLGGLGGFEFRSFALVSIVPELGLIVGKTEAPGRKKRYICGIHINLTSSSYYSYT
jgi:hypothetical protein